MSSSYFKTAEFALFNCVSFIYLSFCLLTFLLHCRTYRDFTSKLTATAATRCRGELNKVQGVTCERDKEDDFIRVAVLSLCVWLDSFYACGCTQFMRQAVLSLCLAVLSLCVAGLSLCLWLYSVYPSGFSQFMRLAVLSLSVWLNSAYASSCT